MRYFYHAYGLRIASAIELPELVVDPPGDGTAAEVVIRSEPITLAKPAGAAGSEHSWMTSEHVLISFAESGRFLISGGNQIIVERAAGAEESAVRLGLLGPGLGALLHQRGVLVLHASAVEINGGAVAVLADKGDGKSTLAAAFVARGHRLVSDDIVPVQFVGQRSVITHPGFPQLKLYPEAAEQLGDSASDLPRLVAGTEKRARRLQTAFSLEPLPLRALYVLENAEAENIALVPAKQAFMLLVRHTFVLPILRATSTQAVHMGQLSELLGRVSMCSLQRRRSLALLPGVVEMVERDLAAATSDQ
jgi:hypothetical protein